MQSLVWGCIAVWIFGLSGCASAPRPSVKATDHIPNNQIRVSDRFERLGASKENIVEVARSCMPSYPPTGPHVTDLLQMLPMEKGQTLVLSHNGSAHRLLIAPEGAVCVRSSQSGYPILAAEAFWDTMTPIGVDDATLLGWFRQLALQLARTRSVKVAYPFSDGQAYLVTYWVETDHPLELRYYLEFRKVGSWEHEYVDFRFSDPRMTGLISTQREKRHVKVNLIEARSVTP